MNQYEQTYEDDNNIQTEEQAYQAWNDQWEEDQVQEEEVAEEEEEPDPQEQEYHDEDYYFYDDFDQFGWYGRDQCL